MTNEFFEQFKTLHPNHYRQFDEYGKNFWVLLTRWNVDSEQMEYDAVMASSFAVKDD